MKQQTKLPPPPAHLGQEMAAFWLRLTREYEFAPEHLLVLQVACTAFDRAQACREQIKKDGLTVRSGKDNKRVRHPLLGVEAKAQEMFLRSVRELGLEVPGATK